MKAPSYTDFKEPLLIRQALVLTAQASESELIARIKALGKLWACCEQAGFTQHLASIPANFPGYQELKWHFNLQGSYWQHGYRETPGGHSFAYVYEYDDILALVIVEKAMPHARSSPAIFGENSRPEFLSDELFFCALSDQSDTMIAQKLNDFGKTELGGPNDFSSPVLLPWGGRFFANKAEGENSGRLRAAVIAPPANEKCLASWLYTYSTAGAPPFLKHHISRAKLFYHEKVYLGYWKEIRAARHILDQRMDTLLPHLNETASQTTPAETAALLEAQRDAARLGLWESHLEALAVTLDISKAHLSERADVPPPAGSASAALSDWFDIPVKRVTALLTQLDDERRYSQVRRARFGYLTSLVQAVQAERQQEQREQANQLREIGVVLVGGMTMALTMILVLGNDSVARAEPYHWPFIWLGATAAVSLPLLFSRWKQCRWDVWNCLLAALPIGAGAWLAMALLRPRAPWEWTAAALLLPPLVALLGFLVRKQPPQGQEPKLVRPSSLAAAVSGNASTTRTEASGARASLSGSDTEATIQQRANR